MEDTKEATLRLADFLRSRKGMPVRHGVEMGKRVEYFKGSRLCSFLIEKAPKNKAYPSCADKAAGQRLGQLLLNYGFIHRSERDEKNKKLLTPLHRNHDFVLDGYYTWMYDGPKTIRHILTTLLIVGFLCLVCFPLWPQAAKVGVWYMSVTFLIFMTVFSTVRMIIFFIMWLCGYDFWILPNIFDDNLGVIESFRPRYSFVKTEDSERIYRVVGFIAFTAFCVYIMNQPTDFDEYLEITRQFTEDMYSGKLLDDMSQKQRDDMDKLRIPALDELLREEEEDSNNNPTPSKSTDDENDAETEANQKKFEQYMEDTLNADADEDDE
jgi:translocation protein SEC62